MCQMPGEGRGENIMCSIKKKTPSNLGCLGKSRGIIWFLLNMRRTLLEVVILEITKKTDATINQSINKTKQNIILLSNQ